MGKSHPKIAAHIAAGEVIPVVLIPRTSAAASTPESTKVCPIMCYSFSVSSI